MSLFSLFVPLLLMVGCASQSTDTAELAKEAQVIKQLRSEPDGCQDLGLVRSFATGSSAKRELRTLVGEKGGNTMVVHKKTPGFVRLPTDSKAPATIAHAYDCD